MKQTPLILSIISLVAVVALGILHFTSKGSAKSTAAGESVEATAQPGAIVWFDLDRVTDEYDMANDLRTVVETKVQSISEEVNRRGTKLQNDVNKFQSDLDKGLLVRSVAEQRSQKLQEQQNNFNNYAAQKQQEINEEQQVMLNQIADAINTFVQKFAEENEYAMVISTQGGILSIPVVAAAAELDVTDAIINGLNSEYVKSKGKGSAGADSDKNE
ncbi:MAG: OmpH family outer membrane protein [Candidatus Cryptobacteroides sp.]